METCDAEKREYARFAQVVDSLVYRLDGAARESFLSCERGFSVLSKRLFRMAEEALLRCGKACPVGRNGLYGI